MSANTSLKEGGKARAFGPVTALMVQGDDGKYLPWVPESERQLDTKSVNKNGVYQAKKDGVYGWRSVSVNVPTDQGVTGTDPTTGQQVAVGVGPTGELTETVVPVEIRVETPPTFTGPYGDRAYIDFSGLTVAAYGEDGNKMQDVPFNELIFPVTVTDINQAQPGQGERDVTGTDLNAPVYLKPLAVGMYYNNLLIQSVEGSPYGILIRTSNTFYGMASYLPSAVTTARDDGSHQEYYRCNTEYTYGGKTCCIGGGITTGVYIPERVSIPISAKQKQSAEETAGIALLGTKEIGGGQYVPVLWQRPGDGAVLETGFYIDVVDVSPSNNDGD